MSGVPLSTELLALEFRNLGGERLNLAVAVRLLFVQRTSWRSFGLCGGELL